MRGIFVIHFIIFSIRIFAQAGTLDNSFGTNGKVFTSFDNFSYDNPSAVAIQAGGKIVVGGSSSSGTLYFALSRYNMDGNLDSTFGNDGKVISYASNYLNYGKCIAIQPDGKILLGGCYFPSSGSGSISTLLRFNTVGTPDSTFGNSGIVTYGTVTNFNSFNSVAIQTDGKIVLGGTWSPQGIPGVQFSLWRYEVDGNLDSTFGNGGVVHALIDSSHSSGGFVKIQGDGKILLAGTVGVFSDFGLMRFNATGSPDSSFGGEGYVITDFGDSVSNVLSAVEIQNDQKIIEVGESEGYPLDHKVNMVRLKEDGSMDSSFGINGKVISDLGWSDVVIRDMKLQPDGKILLGGEADMPSIDYDYFLLARLDQHGILDQSFGDSGTVITDMSYDEQTIISMALQQDGRIVCAGAASVNNYTNFAIARYLNDISLETTQIREKKSPSILFPNPCSKTVFLKLLEIPDAGTNVQLYDPLGKLVKQEKISTLITKIDLNHLLAGIYFWQLHSDNKVLERGKLIIE